MWSVVKSNAIAQDPTSTACIPLVFSFSAPIVCPLFSFSFYLLLSLALTSLESQEICSFSFILGLHLLQSIPPHVSRLPFFSTWNEICTGERVSKWLCLAFLQFAIHYHFISVIVRPHLECISSHC